MILLIGSELKPPGGLGVRASSALQIFQKRIWLLVTARSAGEGSVQNSGPRGALLKRVSVAEKCDPTRDKTVTHGVPTQVLYHLVANSVACGP